MKYEKYPDEETVNGYIKRKEPLIIAIPFDEEKPILMSHVDDAFEHHILLAQFDIRQTDIDKYFRIVADDESAEWTFVCPHAFTTMAFRQFRKCFRISDISRISAYLSGIGGILTLWATTAHLCRNK